MESRFGHDFSHVRLHTDAQAAASARAVNALAYTVDRNIVFAEGRYGPRTSAGRELLAHELAHVVQQSGGVSSGPIRLATGMRGAAAEAEADALARSVVHGEQPQGSSHHTSMLLQRQRGTDDPIHGPVIESYRRERGLPPGGVDLYGQPVGPSEAEIKYRLTSPVRDPGRIRIDALPDILAGSLAAPRDVHVHVNDPNVVSIYWNLVSPDGHVIETLETTPGQPNSTSRPFQLRATQFSGSRFVAGLHMLYCYGRNASGRSIVYGVRDFNVLQADLTTGTALATTYGELTFTQYDKTDATPTNPRFSVNVTLQFLPTTAVTCSQVGWIQTVQSLSPQGQSRQSFINPEQDARQTPLAWSLDRIAGGPTPFYGTSRTAAGAITMPAGKGAFGSGGAHPTAASMIDVPSAAAEGVRRFEACAICRSTDNNGQVYGCATWGYSANAAGAVTLMPRSFRQMPSEPFMEARDAWNAWRATRPAASRPEAAPALRRP
jgi:hypothetical protein